MFGPLAQVHLYLYLIRKQKSHDLYIITICQCRETGDRKSENNPPHCEESMQPATNKNNTSLHTL